MESNLNKLEVGVSHCAEKTEFHFGKGETEKAFLFKTRFRNPAGVSVADRYFYYFPTFSSSFFLISFYLHIIKPFRLQHIAKQISCNAV